MPVDNGLDLVQALAAPLPDVVIAEMLGVEDGDIATLNSCSGDFQQFWQRIVWHI